MLDLKIYIYIAKLYHHHKIWHLPKFTRLVTEKSFIPQSPTIIYWNFEISRHDFNLKRYNKELNLCLFINNFLSYNPCYHTSNLALLPFHLLVTYLLNAPDKLFSTSTHSA